MGFAWHDTYGEWGTGEITFRPSPTVTVGPHSVNSRHYQVWGTGDLDHDPETGELLRCKPSPDPTPRKKLIKMTTEAEAVPVEAGHKPPYRVPSMAEINALPWNGYTAASTFSGCGGSSLGYRMAGFKVAYANEFVAAARDTYRANASEETIIDDRDIRTVSAEDILADLGMKAGQLDLLDGSPPCASFSTAGKRHKGWGQVKAYSETEQRSDDLFFEFARILEGLQPKVFVAENVSGLVKGSAKGYFKDIIKALKATGYHVQARLLDAQWLGVPQARQRLIFIGTRNDLSVEPRYPRPLPYRYSVADALPWILAQACPTGGFGPEGYMRPATVPSPTIGAGPSSGDGYWPPSKVLAQPTDPENGQTLGLPPSVGGEWHEGGGRSERYTQVATVWPDRASPTVIAQSQWQTLHPSEPRKLTLAELRRICGFPDDFKLTGNYSQGWERLGRAVPPVMMAAIASTIRDEILGAL